MNPDRWGSNLSLQGGLNCLLLSPWCSRWWAPSSAQTPAAWRLQSCRRWSNPPAHTWPPPPPRPASAGWMLRSATESEANGLAHSNKNLKWFNSVSLSAQCDSNQWEICVFSPNCMSSSLISWRLVDGRKMIHWIYILSQTNFCLNP